MFGNFFKKAISEKTKENIARVTAVTTTGVATTVVATGYVGSAGLMTLGCLNKIPAAEKEKPVPVYKPTSPFNP